MRTHNDNAANDFNFATYLTAKQMDPLSRKVLAQNARQIEMAYFLIRIISKMVGGIKKVVFGIAAWLGEGNTYRELNAMPDYILNDIGIRRDQINAVVTGKLVRETVQPSPAEVQPLKAVADSNDEDHPLAA